MKNNDAFLLCNILRFLLTDLFILILYWKVIGDKYYIIHHCTALYAYYFILVSARIFSSLTSRQDWEWWLKGEGKSKHIILTLYRPTPHALRDHSGDLTLFINKKKSFTCVFVLVCLWIHELWERQATPISWIFT